jgi:hypothetical protein
MEFSKYMRLPESLAEELKAALSKRKKGDKK